MRPYKIISANLGWGAQRPETEQGPAVLREHLLNDFPAWDLFLSPAKKASEHKLSEYSERVMSIAAFSKDLVHAVRDTARTHFPVVIGGDHSMAIGTWKGIVAAQAARMNFGLIWIDAHMDSHTPSTSPSMAIHGMPLAVLLGQGNQELVDCCYPGPTLSPHHCVLIGVRSYEAGEYELLKKFGVRIFKMEEVIARGLKACFHEAVSIVTAATGGFGVSLDLDAFDPEEVPGVGSPEPEGLSVEETLVCLERLADHPQLKAFEIAEFNPTLDHNSLTLEVVRKVLKTMLGGTP